MDIDTLKRMGIRVVLLLTALVLYACAATGPIFETVRDSLPPLGENNGRLFLYREYAVFGSAMIPDIIISGKKVGESIPGGVFYVDLLAGEYDIIIPTIFYPGQNNLRVNLEPREVQYIRTWIGASGWGGRAYIELVPETTAINAMKGLAVTNEKTN